MTNRWMIGLLVLLVVISGGAGYYSFTLNRQVDRLSERITVFEDEQKSRVEAVSSELGTLRTGTEREINSLDSQVAGARSDIKTLTTDLAAAADRIAGAEDIIGGVSSQVATLDERVAGAEASVSGLSASVIDAGALYEKAVRATVAISNGKLTAGSGFIYDTEGRVVTAYHVVSGLSPIYIIMYDGRVSRADIAGYSEVSDIAVLKLETNPAIEPLPLGDSGKIRVGEPVIAIGSPLADNDQPLGLMDTLTSGIISRVNCAEIYGTGYNVPNLLQLDAAINFGNSGGPLFDTAGRVIGVVVARVDPVKGDGIYWAVASNKVKRVVEAIITRGSFTYPWIGVGLTDLTPQYVTDKSLATSNGALVTSVYSGSPAQTAGLLAGDVIVSIDGVAAKNIADLTSYLGEFKSPGDKAVIEVIRGTGRLQITVTIGTRPQ
jgi:S1-C subfamily serine protease